MPSMDLMRRNFGLSLLIVSLFSTLALAQNQKPLFTLEVSAGDVARENEVVSVLVKSDAQTDAVELTDADGNTFFGQLSAPSIHMNAEGEEGLSQLTFVLPALAAGKTMTLSASSPNGKYETFYWNDNGESEATLGRSGRDIMKYMYTPLDDSTEEKRGETYKVYHHVYSPSGDKLVTKGPGGKFPHHRGLFYGFNRLSYDGKTADVWHCRDGAYQSHEGSTQQIVGPVFGRHEVQVAWRGKDGEPFATEAREMTAYKIGDATLIEFNSRLETTGSKVVMKGDPQHAGFQFRAAQSVADVTNKKTYYIRPDGKGEPGKFRNWKPNADKMTELDKNHVDLPWNAMNFCVGESNYTCCYLDLDSNPKQSRFSERDYGRFGSYFEYELTPEKPLNLNYRIWLQDGEMTVEEIDAISKSFRNPVTVTVN